MTPANIVEAGRKAGELYGAAMAKRKSDPAAAKAELGTMLDADSTGNGLPVPRIWFPVVKQYANTRYYKEVLKECEHFASWARK